MRLSARAYLLGSQGEGRGGQAINVGLVSDELFEGLGGVQQVVAELGADLAQLLLYLVEALLRLPLHQTQNTQLQIASQEEQKSRPDRACVLQFLLVQYSPAMQLLAHRPV